MGRPLTITSTTNLHALSAYAGIAFLGAVYVIIGPPSPLSSNLGRGLASLLMTALFMCGSAAFTAALVASRRSDPSRALSIEILTVALLAGVLGVTLWSVVLIYGVENVSTIVLLAIPTAGCLGRLIQAGWERWRIFKARKSRLSTVEVLEDPTKD